MSLWIRHAGRVAALGVMLLLSTAGPGLADEGMWTFDNFPSAMVKAKYGIAIDQAWLAKVQAATARLSVGCSTAVVSSQGLILTNYHCAADCAQDLSSPNKDYVKEGFQVSTVVEERRCPGMEADILVSIGDVTAQVQSAIGGKSAHELVAARDGIEAQIEKAACAAKQATLNCEVVSFYGGEQYKLYVYRKFTAVRLVFAPESDAGLFGGDPDNFNFPRYDLDVSFLRLYADGRPVATPDHLKWNASPPTDKEPVLVVGDPGSTSRLLTADQLETLRAVILPQTLLRLSELRGRLISFGERGADEQRIADQALMGIENDFKELYGEFQALSEPGFIEIRRAAAAALRSQVAANPGLAARIGDPWLQIAKVQAARADQTAAYNLIEAVPGEGSDLYAYARRLVRAAQERAKPDGQRLAGYGDARLPELERQVLDPRPVYPALERIELEFWLAKIRETLGPDAPQTQAFLGKVSPEDLAARLTTSTLGDPAVRRALWEGGLPAVMASRDPLILYVLATDPVARAVRTSWEDKVAGPTAAAAEKIAEARFAVYGASAYPDATFTPRVSFGEVEGWTWRDHTTLPFTTFAGLWNRATGSPPFALAPSWLAARGRLKDGTIFDFTTDNDIAGGNSGSPVIDAKGEIIGAAFDGNILSLGGSFAFDDDVNRSVAVSTAAVTEALDIVYHDEPLLAELRAP
jgi:hypothetical protein